MFCHKGSDLALGKSIERPMLSGMHLVFPSRLVVVQLLQFVVFVTWVVDRLSRVSLLHNVKWLWCLLLFSALASKACYLLGGSGDCWRKAACGSFYRSSSSWWWCWWCREWFGGCAWWPGEWRWFPRLLENSRLSTAVTKSRKVETWTLILNLLASVFADKTFRVGENVQSSTFLWMILAFKLTLRKTFPTSPHSLHFAFGVKSSHLPSWITSWSKPTCMHTANAIFLLFLLSGYHHFPEEDHHWSNCEDLGVPIVSKAMSRASFRNIKRHIHFADNHNVEQGNKIAKVAPVYTSVNATLAKFGVSSSTKICRLMNRWCHTLGATVRRYSFVESPSASGTHSQEPLRFEWLSVPPASLQRQRGNIQQRAPRHEGRQSHGRSCLGDFWCCKAPLLLRQLLHIPQAPFRLGIRESESYWHSEGKPDRRSKPWFDVHQSNEKEHAWNVRLSLWCHRAHVQVVQQLSHHCCKQLPSPLSSAWSRIGVWKDSRSTMSNSHTLSTLAIKEWVVLTSWTGCWHHTGHQFVGRNCTGHFLRMRWTWL